jgi:DNA (cytosine-5)-methyltransferase 1
MKIRTIGSLFAGVGGLELGLERVLGARVLWQVEIDPFRREVLARHWPGARRFADVRAIKGSELEGVDLVCGGFPCQDVSAASRGRSKGLAGERSGLWREYRRIVEELRPRWVVVENVANWATKRWLPAVRQDLHLLGYRTRALRVDARDVGAPHARARIFVVGHPHEEGEPARAVDAKVARVPAPPGLGGHWREPFSGPVRVADGLPLRLDRLRALGDAVVPQCAELVGRVILQWSP